MKKLLSILSILTISGTAVPTLTAAKNYQNQNQKNKRKNNSNRRRITTNQYKSMEIEKSNKNNFKENPKKHISKYIKKTKLGKIKNNDEKTILEAICEKNTFPVGIESLLEIKDISESGAWVEVVKKQNTQATFSEINGDISVTFTIDRNLQ